MALNTTYDVNWAQRQTCALLLDLVSVSFDYIVGRKTERKADILFLKRYHSITTGVPGGAGEQMTTEKRCFLKAELFIHYLI